MVTTVRYVDNLISIVFFTYLIVVRLETKQVQGCRSVYDIVVHVEFIIARSCVVMIDSGSRDRNYNLIAPAVARSRYRCRDNDARTTPPLARLL